MALTRLHQGVISIIIIIIKRDTVKPRALRSVPRPWYTTETLGRVKRYISAAAAYKWVPSVEPAPVSVGDEKVPREVNNRNIAGVR